MSEDEMRKSKDEFQKKIKDLVLEEVECSGGIAFVYVAVALAELVDEAVDNAPNYNEVVH